jgi:hypothetical protein
MLLAPATLATPLSSARAAHPAQYKGRFDFTTVDVQPVSATVLLGQGSLAGNETHLGRFTGEVEYLVGPNFAFTGSLAKTAGDGDGLDETVSGQLTPEGSFGEFTITSGTGRFQGASGGATFESTWTDAAMTAAHITFDGSLSLAGRGNYRAEGAVAFSNARGRRRPARRSSAATATSQSWTAPASTKG